MALTQSSPARQDRQDNQILASDSSFSALPKPFKRHLANKGSFFRTCSRHTQSYPSCITGILQLLVHFVFQTCRIFGRKRKPRASSKFRQKLCCRISRNCTHIRGMQRFSHSLFSKRRKEQMNVFSNFHHPVGHLLITIDGLLLLRSCRRYVQPLGNLLGNQQRMLKRTIHFPFLFP